MSIEAKLIVVEGAAEAEISLKLPTVIGRSDQAALKVRTSVVSREHCRLFEKNGFLFVEDLKSSNGTFVNEERITTMTKIASGDFLTVGPVTLKVVCENDTRSIGHDPYTGEYGVLNESPQQDAESPSNVHYKETVEGSFLGIDDSMPLNLGARQVVKKSAGPDLDPLKFDGKGNPHEPKKEISRKNKRSTKRGTAKKKDQSLDDFLNNIV